MTQEQLQRAKAIQFEIEQTKEHIKDLQFYILDKENKVKKDIRIGIISTPYGGSNELKGDLELEQEYLPVPFKDIALGYTVNARKKIEALEEEFNSL